MEAVTDVVHLHPTGKRNDDENAKEKLYVVATHVPTTEFKVSCEPAANEGYTRRQIR